MRQEGIYSRLDGKFEVWVRILGGLECKGTFGEVLQAKSVWYSSKQIGSPSYTPIPYCVETIPK